MDNLHNLPAFRRPTASRRHTHRLTQQVRLILPLTLTIILMTAFIVSAEKKGNIGKQPIQQKKKTEIENADGNKYYLITDEMACGGVRIKSVATCPSYHEMTHWQLECEQELFVNTRLFRGKDEPGNTTQWGCVRAEKSSHYYVVIDFYSGGNCWACEWSEVYNLNGSLIITDLIDSKRCDKKNSKYIKTSDGFVDEFALMGCSQAAIEERERNVKKIESLKHGNKKAFKPITFEKEG